MTIKIDNVKEALNVLKNMTSLMYSEIIVSRRMFSN